MRERRRRAVLPPAPLPRRARRARRGAAARARARRRPRRGARPPRRVRAGSPRATRRRARSPRCPPSERFHWLVAPASTIIQCSPVHTGLTDDPRGRARAAGRAARALSPGRSRGSATPPRSSSSAASGCSPIRCCATGSATCAATGRRRSPTLLRDVDAVLISHLHFDHLDVPSLRRLRRDVRLLVPRGAGGLLHRQGFPHAEELAVGEAAHVARRRGRRRRRRCTTGGAARTRAARPPTRSASCVGGRVYFAGDTDLFDEMAELQRHRRGADPRAGAGARRSGDGHLDPPAAARATALAAAARRDPDPLGHVLPARPRALQATIGSPTRRTSSPPRSRSSRRTWTCGCSHRAGPLACRGSILISSTLRKGLPLAPSPPPARHRPARRSASPPAAPTTTRSPPARRRPTATRQRRPTPARPTSSRSSPTAR